METNGILARDWSVGDMCSIHIESAPSPSAFPVLLFAFLSYKSRIVSLAHLRDLVSQVLCWEYS